MSGNDRKTFNLSRTMDGVAQGFKGKSYMHLFDKRKNKGKNITLNLKECIALQRKLPRIIIFLKRLEKASVELMDNDDESGRSSGSDFD